MGKKKFNPAKLASAYVSLHDERPKYTGTLRTANHKVRSDWFRQRTAWPIREASIGHLVGERTRALQTLPNAPGAAQWEAIGPTNVGGRLTCAVTHPADANRIWVGAAGGGVWFSADTGVTWRSLWHQEASLNIGALAIDSTNPDILYAATGEANLSADSYAGVGVYRTVNGGLSWLLLAPADATGIPTRIGAFALDPTNSQRMRLGGIGYASDLRNGLFASIDGGTTWTRDPNLLPTQSYWCHAVVYHPTNAQTIYVAITAQGNQTGIYRTTNGGTSWTQLTTGLPAPSFMGRISLAIAPSNPLVLYAMVADADGNRVLGVFRTANGGTSWTDIAGNHFVTPANDPERQMSYNNTIVVHPTDKDHVLCGGVDIHQTTDGGTSWTKVTVWSNQRGDPDYAHADQHCLLMPATAAGRAYACNDGGLDVSTDGGTTWVNRSTGLAVTMFYDLDVAQTNLDFYGGGCQDNGTQITTNGAPDGFFDITGGDGGWIIFDIEDESHIFASIYNLNVFRFRNTTGWKDISPPATDAEKERVWMCFLEINPDDTKVLFAGGLRVWRTKNDGNTWQAVSGVLDSSPITAVAIAASDTNRIYIGTQNGGFFRSLDGGDTWSGNLAGPIPGRTITRIDVPADDEDVVVVTVANMGHSHVFRSTDGGLNWTDIDQGQLPDVPFHALVIPPDKPNTIYAVSDAGVFVSTNSGGSWATLSRNLPNVMIVDVVYHEATQQLVVATYGRSLWRLQV